MAAPVLKKRRITSYEGVTCPLCGTRIPQVRMQSGDQACTGCRGEYEAFAFTPPVRKARVKHVAESGPDGATACARHERNAAVANCERCGNFMCSLCRIDTDGMALCPPCFERLSDEGALANSVKTFKNYGGIAASLAIGGLFTVWMFIGVLFGPAAVVYAVKGMKQRRLSGESDGLVGLWLSLILGVLVTAIGIVYIAAIFGVFRRL
jgi:hypothetical protein